MNTNESIDKIRAAAQVILNTCSSHDGTRTQLERVSYASAVIRHLADEAIDRFEMVAPTALNEGWLR